MLDPIRKHLRIGGGLLTLLLAFLALYTALTSNHLDPAASQQRTTVPSTSTLRLMTWCHSLRLQDSDHGPYTPSGRNIFQLVSESSNGNNSHPPPTPIRTPRPFEPDTPVIPIQPHANLTFYGFVKKQGAAKRVFLQDGENIFNGTEGEIVDRHYKIVRVAENFIEIQDLLTNQSETLPLQQHS